MLKRDISELAVYRVEEEKEILPLECLRSLYLEKASEIIYITRNDKLYGIICLGDVIRHSVSGGGKNNQNIYIFSGL